MEGLKEDTAFRLKGLETKEQFIAQNTHKLPAKELRLLQNLPNTINMQQETNTNSEFLWKNSILADVGVFPALVATAT